MKVLLLLSTAVAAALHATTPAAPPPAANADRRLVSGFLITSGFSDYCVARLFDHCEPSQLTPPPHPSDALMQEAMKLQQEGIKLLQEIREMLHQSVQRPQHCEDVLDGGDGGKGLQNTTLLQEPKRPQHCKELLDGGDSGKGLRHIYPFPQQPQRNVTVYCDHTVDGGGWTVFQRRSNESSRENFDRTWDEYREGFGDLEGEFWLGLNLLHELTSSQPQELRIELADYEGGTRYAKYGSFSVGPPDDEYRLSVGRYTGDAGDDLTAGWLPHHGQKFSTPDADNDAADGDNCAAEFSGGWWYNNCLYANLNGFQHEGTYEGVWAGGIVWRGWRGLGYSLRHTAMMTRPAH